MKPYVVCHMVASVDGRILNSRWRPRTRDSGDLFERLHIKLDGDAWVVGRVTGQEFAKAKAYDAQADRTHGREPWLARRDAETYGVVLDAHGRIAWGRADIGGDPIVIVLTEQVSVNRELGVERLLVEGGGGSNGAFLRAGLIDEISLAILPVVDGSKGAPSVFDSTERESELRAPVEQMSLESCEVLDGGGVWLRYGLRNEGKPARSDVS